MSKPSTPHPLLRLLETQQQDAARMLAVLKQEYHALKNNDLPAFDEAMDAKLRHIKHLEQQERTLQPALEGIIGAPADRDSLESYIVNSRQPQLRETWQVLRRTLEDCQRQNLLNQRILETSRAQVQRALDILRGAGQEGDKAEIYGGSGKTESAGGGQSLGIV